MLKRCFVSRSFIGVVSILALTAISAFADPKDDIQAGVQKLANSDNYSWETKTAVQGGGFGAGTVNGKAQKDGLADVKGTARGTPYEFIIKGDKTVIQVDNTWKTPAEAMADDDQGGPSPTRFLAMRASSFRTPVEQMQNNLDKLENIQKTDNGYTADLTPDCAKELLSFRPRRPTTNPDDNTPQIDISDAKGSVKVWCQDGTISKFEVHLTGSISFNGGDPRDVDRTMTTEFKDVGSTTIDVPADAKAKLGM